MKMTFDEIKAATRELSEEEQEALALSILRDLDRKIDAGVEEAWAREAHKRAEGILRGERRTFPAEQVLSELRAKIAS